jgi:iron complex outermembrane receptor protein
LYYYHNSLGFTPFTQVGAVIPAAAQFQTNQTTSFTTSYSAYGQVTAPVYDKTNLTAGLRYTIDDHFEESATYTALGESGVLNRSTRTREPTYRLAIDHQFSDTLLGYVSDNRGFHGGLYNTASPAQPFVAPEVVNAYEIGLKTELFDRRLRLNMAGFYNRLKDFQVKTLASNGAGVLLNAPQAVLKGVDVDFSAVRIHGLQIQGGMSYLNGTFTNFANAPFYSVNPAGGLLQQAGAGNADGNQTPFSASWVASLAADYRVATPIGTLTLTLSNYYNGGFYFDPQNRVAQKAYDLLNSSLNWTSNSGKAELSFWARNLLNKKYYTFVAVSTAGDEYYPGAPLTFGFTASYHF